MVAKIEAGQQNSHISKRQEIAGYLLASGTKRSLTPQLQSIVGGIAVTAALYHLWAVFAYPEPILHRGIAFGFFFALVFLVYAAPGTDAKAEIPLYDWGLSLLSAMVSLYLFFNLDRIVIRSSFVDPLLPGDLVFSLLTVLLIIEGTRRMIGPWLAALSLMAVAYALAGQYIPGLFGHNGFTFRTVMEELFLTTDAIWGQTMGMACTYIILFIIFGAFLQKSGAGDFLFNFSSALAGWSRGGLAKVSVIASGLFGMISGSPGANISSVGTITIPMMVKSGYPPGFAAAVECCASTGGTIMPPVMGSVAFIMAEVIGVPYRKIILAAALPAIIYYAALFFTIDFRAGKLGMKGLSREEIPPIGATLRQGCVFILPLAALVSLIMSGVSPSRAAFETIIAILVISGFRRETRFTPRRLYAALRDGALQSMMIIVTMAASGILIGLINLTGLGNKFSSFLLAMSGQSLFATLALVMLLTLFLGMPLNITPSYLLAAVVAGPVLIGMGINPLAAHFFILYYAAMAPMTPPIASTAFVAAGIAGTEPMRSGILSMRIALVAYIMPFLFVFQPALLMESSSLHTVVAFASGILAAALLAMAMEGWYKRQLGAIERAVLFCAGILALTGYGYLIAAALGLTLLTLGWGKTRSLVKA